MVGEVGGEEEEGEREASGRREGNTMGDGEDVFALCDKEDALGGEDEEEASGASEATPRSGKTCDREARNIPIPRLQLRLQLLHPR